MTGEPAVRGDSWAPPSIIHELKKAFKNFIGTCLINTGFTENFVLFFKLTNFQFDPEKKRSIKGALSSNFDFLRNNIFY